MPSSDQNISRLTAIVLLALAGCSVEGPEAPASSAKVRLRNCNGTAFIAGMKAFSARNRMHFSGSPGGQGSAYLVGDGVSIFVSNEVDRCSYNVFLYRERGGSDELIRHYAEALQREISANRNLGIELTPPTE